MESWLLLRLVTWLLKQANAARLEDKVKEGNFDQVFFINSDLTQTQILTLKLTLNLTLTYSITTTQTVILTLKKANQKCTDEYFLFLFYSS